MLNASLATVLLFSLAMQDPAPPEEPAGRAMKPEDLENALREKLEGPRPQERGPKRTLVNGLPTDKLGDELPDMKPFRVPDLVRNAKDYAGTAVVLRGQARRTCNTGCWVELSDVPSSPVYVRVVPGPGIMLFSSQAPRRITAYGVLKKVRLTAARAAELDAQAVSTGTTVHKLKGGDEWVLEVTAMQVQWLD